MENNMDTTSTMRDATWTKVGAIAMAAMFILAACSSSSDGLSDIADPPLGGDTGFDATYDQGDTVEGAVAPMAEEPGAAASRGSEAVSVPVGLDGAPFDAKVIRDGSVDLRIDRGTFGPVSTKIRSIAADLGGYVSSGESNVDIVQGERYAVGWFTIRIPSDRFDDAVARIEALGVPVSSSLSSEDVSEEYVDLEGRLKYWRDQEAFYTRLMDEAETIEDLVVLQTRMQDVLLTIEQIEGRIRYLDARTDFATLTVGLTEVPDTLTASDVPGGDGPIAHAFDQAGEVLLATVSFIIVGVAGLIPLAILVVFAYAVIRLFMSLRRKRVPAEGGSLQP